jgi:hypothetical protein
LLVLCIFSVALFSASALSLRRMRIWKDLFSEMVAREYPPYSNLRMHQTVLLLL